MFSLTNNPLPTILVRIDRPGATALQITYTETGVTLGYLNGKMLVKAEHITFVDEPELKGIVEMAVTGDVWDMEAIICLADKAETPAAEPTEWHWAGPWVDSNPVAFRNPPAAVQAAS